MSDTGSSNSLFAAADSTPVGRRDAAEQDSSAGIASPQVLVASDLPVEPRLSDWCWLDERSEQASFSASLWIVVEPADFPGFAESSVDKPPVVESAVGRQPAAGQERVLPCKLRGRRIARSHCIEAGQNSSHCTYMSGYFPDCILSDCQPDSLARSTAEIAAL